jgi:hypothetical protein
MYVRMYVWKKETFKFIANIFDELLRRTKHLFTYVHISENAHTYETHEVIYLGVQNNLKS